MGAAGGAVSRWGGKQAVGRIAGRHPGTAAAAGHLRRITSALHTHVPSTFLHRFPHACLDERRPLLRLCAQQVGLSKARVGEAGKRPRAQAAARQEAHVPKVPGAHPLQAWRVHAWRPFRGVLAAVRWQVLCISCRTQVRCKTSLQQLLPGSAPHCSHPAAALASSSLLCSHLGVVRSRAAVGEAGVGQHAGGDLHLAAVHPQTESAHVGVPGKRGLPQGGGSSSSSGGGGRGWASGGRVVTAPHSHTSYTAISSAPLCSRQHSTATAPHCISLAHLFGHRLVNVARLLVGALRRRLDHLRGLHLRQLGAALQGRAGQGNRNRNRMRWVGQRGEREGGTEHRGIVQRSAPHCECSFPARTPAPRQSCTARAAG